MVSLTIVNDVGGCARSEKGKTLGSSGPTTYVRLYLT